METLQGELNNEFTGKTVTITPSADNKEWTIKVDDVEETIPAGKNGTPQVASKLTDDEKTALEKNGISEITGDDISNKNLKENSRIKAVITGDVPLTTEMTYITGTIDTGVVVSIDDNEFVWVPVPVAISENSSTIDTNGIDLSVSPNTLRPMAKLQSGSTENYEGLLYEFYGSTSTFQPTYNINTTNYREPATLSGYDTETAKPYGSDVSFLGAIGLTESGFTTHIQSEYNKMIQSVDKYGGFYVARYELGLDGTTPVSKPASETVTTAVASNSNTSRWYGLYSKTNSMYSESENKNIVSQMIWGSQYDAMMNWMAKTGTAVGTADNNKYNQAQTTGSKAEDIINNVKDLYGCNFEWTQEAQTEYARAVRGGNYSYPNSPANKSGSSPDNTYYYYSSRSALYIK